MFARENSSLRVKMLGTTVATLIWIAFLLGWVAFAWRDYSLLQNLASLGISTLALAAITGVAWVGDMGDRLVITILTSLGWLSFGIYWMSFVWSRYGLLSNLAAMAMSALLALGILIWAWLSPSEDCC